MEPTGKLSSAARDWVQAQGSNATTVQEVIFLSGYQFFLTLLDSLETDKCSSGQVLEGPDVAVMRGIQAGIDIANKEAVSNAQRIQKWMVIPRDFRWFIMLERSQGSRTQDLSFKALKIIVVNTAFLGESWDLP